jgi:hypothetical protein
MEKIKPNSKEDLMNIYQQAIAEISAIREKLNLPNLEQSNRAAVEEQVDYGERFITFLEQCMKHREMLQ